MEFRTIKLQSVLLHYGNEWLWLTAAGSSGLLWNTAKGGHLMHLLVFYKDMYQNAQSNHQEYATCFSAEPPLDTLLQMFKQHKYICKL
jgi:hypothetical protein